MNLCDDVWYIILDYLDNFCDKYFIIRWILKYTSNEKKFWLFIFKSQTKNYKRCRLFRKRIKSTIKIEDRLMEIAIKNEMYNFFSKFLNCEFNFCSLNKGFLRYYYELNYFIKMKKFYLLINEEYYNYIICNICSRTKKIMFYYNKDSGYHVSLKKEDFFYILISKVFIYISKHMKHYNIKIDYYKQFKQLLKDIKNIDEIKEFIKVEFDICEYMIRINGIKMKDNDYEFNWVAILEFK